MKHLCTLLLLLAVAVSSFAQATPVTGTAQAGKQVTISVTASGTQPFTYQWAKVAANAPTGTAPAAIAGATAASLVLTNVTAADAGSYTVTVSNAAGSAVSNQAVLTITQVPPAVTGLSFTVQ